ncbi:MAG: GDP-L-fucose synthase family protein [Candidatus Bilamarchaeum sp.]
MSSHLEGKRVLLTGSRGFLGSSVLSQLAKFNPSEIIAPSSSEYDLRVRAEVDELILGTKPETVIHIAGKTGGIEENRKRPGDFFYDNAAMALNLIDSSFKNKVSKFVGLGTVCSYPKFTPIPFKESDLWNGYPEETNAPYGLSKKMMMVMTQAYRLQYGFNGVHLLAVNLYGPGDNFDPNKSHVIPAMISKLVEAKEKGLAEVIFWGDGSPTREFLYVDDCARGILLAADKYEKSNPVNLGSGMEISIRDLAEKIQNLVGYSGTIVWDKSKPNGQPRRALDTSMAEKEFGFKAQINFNQGLKETIEWYKKHRTSGKRTI